VVASREPARTRTASSEFAPDAALVDALRERQPYALALVFDNYYDHVERVLLRILGRDHELADLVQDAFVQAMSSFERFRGGPESLRAWFTSIATHVARNRIRHRRARWWLTPWAPDEPEPVDEKAGPELVDTVRRTYAVLDALPVDDRIPFALRYFDRMELSEVADACGLSLATVKRRLTRARARFERRARRDPVLRDWVEQEGEP
jgi:RNA polymerase sigma-70 factor (ECF subfamily)